VKTPRCSQTLQKAVFPSCANYLQNFAAQNACKFKGERAMRLIYKFLKDENAATAIEYGLIAAGISIVIITAVKGIGTKLNTTFGSISTQLK
jgi:pilus assembly protein Flp/PilA